MMPPPQLRLKGKVVLMRRNVLHLSPIPDPEFATIAVTCQLISSTVADPDDVKGIRGLVGEEERLDTNYDVTFDWDVKKHGVPGAVIVRNYLTTQFLLKTITIDDVPDHGPIIFVTNSWVYNTNEFLSKRTICRNELLKRTTCDTEWQKRPPPFLAAGAPGDACHLPPPAQAAGACHHGGRRPAGNPVAACHATERTASCGPYRHQPRRQPLCMLAPKATSDGTENDV